MAGKNRKKIIVKSPLTYMIDPVHEEKIRNYVNEENIRTGIKKQRIVSDLLSEIIDMKKNCPKN